MGKKCFHLISMTEFLLELWILLTTHLYTPPRCRQL